MNKAELNFVNEMARKLLVSWCHRTLVGLPAVPPGSPASPVSIDPSKKNDLRIYVEHAKSKNWLNADGSRVLSTGFNTAASFLRR